MAAAAIAVALTCLSLPVFAETPTAVKSGFNMFSPAQDVEIGTQSAADAERQLPLVTDRSVDDFVSEVGARLAAQAPGPTFQYQFRVVDASDLNAFALPGGFLFVNRGVLEAATNEGEVAGVLAHEIAHVALRHGTHNASKAYLTQAGVGLLGAVLGGKVDENTGQIINALGGFGLNALFLKYSRDAETDADVVGAQILARTGYNPADMVGFFRTLEKTDKRRTATWLSSHPAPPQRIQRIEQEAKLLDVANAPTTSTASLDHVKAILRGMPAARTTEQIARMTNAPARAPQRGSSSSAGVSVAPPSTNFRTYTDRDRLYQISYPDNWQIYQGRDHAVTFAPEGGAGEVNGSNEVVYGAIVNHYEPFGNVRPRRGEVTIQEATDDLIKQVQLSSPYLKVVRGSGQSFRVSGGGTGLGATLVGTSPNTRIRERVSVVTRQLTDGHLIYLLLIIPDEAAGSYGAVLTSMVQSLRIDAEGRH